VDAAEAADASSGAISVMKLGGRNINEQAF
jgi:hypothetical protein